MASTRTSVLTSARASFAIESPGKFLSQLANLLKLRIGVVMMLTALLLVFTVLDILAAAAIAAIAAAGIPVAWASLIVGGVAIVIAAGLFLAGKARLNPKNLTPQRTMKHLRRDAETIKETVNV